jgi:hypothetical protein
VPSSNSSISLALYQYDYNIKSAKFSGTNNSNLFNNNNNSNKEILENSLSHIPSVHSTSSSHKTTNHLANGQNNISTNSHVTLAKPERTKSIVNIQI